MDDGVESGARPGKLMRGAQPAPEPIQNVA
jgi:hypothetical protein